MNEFKNLAVNIEYLTDSQLRCKITASVKRYLKDHGYEKVVFFRFIRGTYHFDNCGNFMMSAKGILEAATRLYMGIGLTFNSLNSSMARLNKY